MTKLIEEKSYLFIGVERDSVTSGKLAVLLGLLAGDCLARVVGSVLSTKQNRLR